MGSIASPTRSSSRPEARKGIPWNRAVHRVGGLLAVLIMLWLGITGICMQVIDLHAILTHQSLTTPTGLSMAEGTYGPPDFAIIQATDFNAAALPASFDIQQGVHTVLRAAHGPRDRDQVSAGHPAAGEMAAGARRDPASKAGSRVADHSAEDQEPSGPSGDGQPSPMAWVEVRVLNGIPVGQVMMGTKLEAFDAHTGASVTPVPPVLLPQGRRLPPSLRQRLKTLHRFWNSHDTPGVYFEFIVGLVLWFLLITGLVIYFQMLSTRFRQGRKSLLWLSGGWWRGLHRVVSVVSAAFLLCIAFSGTWIGFESSVGPLRRVLSPTQAVPEIPGLPAHRATRSNPADFIVPLHDREVEEMTAVTLDSMRRFHPSTPIKVIRLRTYGQTKQGAVVTGGNELTDQLVFNADSGEPASLNEMGYPQGNFPFGTQVHENMKHFHSGAMFGVSGRVLNLFAGSSLTFLAISGLWMYVDMWLKRPRANRRSLIWR